MPRLHFACSQAHPTEVHTERLRVYVQLRGIRTRHAVIPNEAMVVAALGTPSPGCASLARTVVSAHISPRLGELVVLVGWVPGWEEDHVVAVA
jgi:hypothetical protein